jgi:hypothetical protein
MILVCVLGATLTTGNQADTVVILPSPASVVSSKVEASGKGFYHLISFTVTLSDTSIGAGVLLPNSEKTSGGGIKYVLEDAEVDVVCTHPTSGATTTVTVSVDDPGQEEVFCD